MNQSDIEHMAQGFPPSSIGKDHEEVVTVLATSLLAAQQKLDAVKALAGVAGEMNGVVKDGFDEVVAQRDALAAENAALKNGIGFFSYGTDSGFEEHDSAEKAIAAADSDIDYYRGDACDGWSEETDQTVWGVIMQRATMIDERPRSEEFPDGSCDYALLPNLSTPATDAYLNSLRAEGVIMFATKQLAAAGDLDSTATLERLMLDAEELAGQLRTGEPS